MITTRETRGQVLCSRERSWTSAEGTQAFGFMSLPAAIIHNIVKLSYYFT